MKKAFFVTAETLAPITMPQQRTSRELRVEIGRRPGLLENGLRAETREWTARSEVGLPSPRLSRPRRRSAGRRRSPKTPTARRARRRPIRRALRARPRPGSYRHWQPEIGREEAGWRAAPLLCPCT